MRIDFVPNFSPGAIFLTEFGLAIGAIAAVLSVIAIVNFPWSIRLKLLWLLLGIGLIVGSIVFANHKHAEAEAAHRHNISALNKAVTETYGIYLTERQAETLVGDSDKVAYGEPTVFMTVEGRKTIVGLHQEQGKWYLMSNAQDLLHVKR